MQTSSQPVVTVLELNEGAMKGLATMKGLRKLNNPNLTQNLMCNQLI